MNIKKFLLILLSVFALVNMFTGWISLIVFVFILLGIQFCCLNKYESSFLILLFANVFGVFFFIYGVRGIGSILFLTALLIFLKEEKSILKRIASYSAPLVLILCYFGLSALFTTGGNYAGEKFFRTCTSAMFTVVPFALFFYKIEKFNLSKLALMVCAYGFFTFSVGVEYLGLPRISNIFDLGYFRIQMAFAQNSGAEVGFNYQNIGFYGCFALSLMGFFKNPTVRTDRIIKTSIYLLSSLVVLYSGSRQSIFAWLILIAIIATKGKVFSLRIIIACSILFVILQWFQSLDLWLFTDLQNANNILEGSQRDKLIEAGMSQFYSSPIWGVGYGRFRWEYGYGAYPHNFMVELLSECGIVGTTIILIIPIYFFFHNILKVHIGKENMVGVLCIIIPYIIRALVSADMSSNIEFFAILFMVPFLKHSKEMGCKYLSNGTYRLHLS